MRPCRPHEEYGQGTTGLVQYGLVTTGLGTTAWYYGPGYYGLVLRVGYYGSGVWRCRSSSRIVVRWIGPGGGLEATSDTRSGHREHPYGLPHPVSGVSQVSIQRGPQSTALGFKYTRADTRTHPADP